MKYLLLYMLLHAASSFAWNGAVKGEISTIEVSNGTDYGFRVWLSGGQELCSNLSPENIVDIEEARRT